MLYEVNSLVLNIEFKSSSWIMKMVDEIKDSNRTSFMFSLMRFINDIHYNICLFPADYKSHDKCRVCEIHAKNAAGDCTTIILRLNLKPSYSISFT